MSNVFEAIICPIDFTITENLLTKSSSELKLEVIKINDTLSVIYRIEENRHKLIFSQQIEYLASKLSLEITAVLVVRYDSRIGHRSSIMFAEGLAIYSFDANDEIWVLLNEEGNPLIDGQKFSINSMNDDEEYETIYDAIQLGFQVLGLDNYNEVYSFIISN
ncbi:hypothetical protein I8752_19330 [Nostocaceae cyanobacterium CENA369]|uniref:Uncharacterized protein n=1 Tax=Dendronalium phyllosphericum CENA369 TaxID=1725256 RepID=A0A8J7I9Y2_9NOST|nr:hypothetical protein [Dendronalium phyllosphericum]MBH8575127.1 hypothetical protein [Dendronalium phyllosphericum CENA369]